MEETKMKSFGYCSDFSIIYFLGYAQMASQRLPRRRKRQMMEQKGMMGHKEMMENMMEMMNQMSGMMGKMPDMMKDMPIED